MTVSHGKLAAIALRYALAPACVGAAVLLHVAPVGPLFHPMGLFILGVVAAAWFGGAGPGVFAAFLSAIVLPHLIAVTYPLSVAYPLLAGFFDLPRFVTLGLTGAAVGWGTGSYRRAAAALRERGRLLSKARDELETAVAERTAHLSASEERYARAMQASKDGIWEWNPTTDEIFMSDRARHLWAVPDGVVVRTRAELKRLGGFHPEDFQRTEDLIAANRVPGPHGFDMEYRVIDPAGEVRWVRSQAEAFPGAAGRPDLVTGSLTDVTDHKRAEEELRESEKRYERVMLASNAGVWDWDVVKDKYYVSPQFLELCGIPPGTTFSSREDFIRHRPIHPEDREKWEQAVRRLFASRDARAAMEVRSIVNGESRWRRLEGICFRDATGRVVRWTGTSTDITERKRTEEALRRSEERFALALAASSDGIWDWDLVTDEQFFSERVQRIFGLEPGPMVRPHSEWDALREFHPEDGPRRLAAVERHLAGETPVYEGEWRVRPMGGGEYRWIHTRGLCVRDVAGRPIRMVGSVTDIDERKRIEAALRQSEERSSLAMEATEEGDFDLNIDTGELFISERLNEVYGFPPGTRFANRGEYLALVRLHDADAEKYHAALAAAVAKDGPERYEFEFRILRPSGEVRWLRTRGKVARDAEGRARRRTGVVADVTARKLAEEALRASEERYALAMEAAGDGHTDWNLVTGEFYISPRLLRILGYAPGTIFADRADWVRRFPFHPEDRRMWEVAVAAHFAGREAKFRMDLRIVVNGETRWVAFTFIATRDASGEPVRWTGSIADINDAKLAEQALRESQERYALAVAGSDDGVWDCDFATGRVFISARARELAGMPPGPEMVAMDEWFAKLPIHPEDLPRRTGAVQAHLAGKTPAYVGEFRLLHPDGVYRWRRLHGLCLRDANGNPQRMAGSISDVDARRRAEEALRLSEERYALAMEVAEEGHFDWNVQTDEIFASAQAKRVMHVPQDVDYRTRSDIMARVRYHPDDWPRISAQWREALAGRGVEHDFEYRILRGEEPRWIRGRWKVFRDEAGAALRVIGIVADITSPKLAEEALRESQERYALAVAGANDGIWDWDLVTGMFYRSPRNQQITMGRPSDGIDVLHVDEWSQWFQLHPDDAPKRDAAIRLHLEGRTPLYEIEYRVRHQDGAYHWVQARGVCIRDASGRALRFAGSTSDIDGRKAAEEALRASEERYALAVAGSDDGVWDVDFAERRVFVSARGRELSGLPPGPEMLPMDEFFAGLPLHPEDAPRRIAAMQAHLAGKTPAYEGEFRLRQADGVYRWRRLRGLCSRDADGKPQRMAGSISDIDARRRAEEALRLSEERYALALEASEEGHFDNDLETGEIFVSARVNEIYSFPRQARILNRIEFLNQIPFHPDDRHVLAELSRTDWQDGAGELYELECRIVPRPGETRWIHSRAKVVRDAEGRARRRIGVVADITDRKLAAEALRLSEERYAYAMEAAQDAHWDWIVGTDQYYTSPRVVDVFGLPPDTTFTSRQDYLAKTPLVKEDLDVWLRAARELFAGTGSRLSMELRAIINGEVRWIQHNGLCVRDASGRAVRWCGSVRDVTERRRAEEALRLSEERYALAMEVSEEGHFDWNVQTDAIFASAHLKKVLDLPADAEYRTRGDMVADIPYYPGDRERTGEMTRDVLVGSALQHEFEYRIRHRETEEARWIHARWKIFRDADGVAQRVIGVVSDITERKQAVDTLRESELRFRTLVELNSNGFWVQDENLRYTSSPLTSDVAGYDKHGMDGKTRWELSGDPTPLFGSWQEHQADLAARRPFRDFEYRRMRPDGQIGYYNASGAPIFDEDGRFKGYYGVASDITERKRVEEELRSRQEMLELAQKSARAIAFEWKIGEGEGENRWSPDLEAMYGFAPGTYDGTFGTWKKCVHPEDWPAVKEAVRHAHNTGEVASEYRVVHPDGSVHWLQARGRMFFDAVGDATRMVGFMQDITQRKQAEDELRKMEQELRRAQRLEAIGTLAGGIAHDFNNILGAILGYGEMAMRDAKKGTRLYRDLDSVMAAGERGRSLVDRILAFSRSGVGERVPVHVEAVVREALDQVAASLPGNVTIAPRLRAGRAAMLGDSTQVHQVVMNLASNAVQAMLQGGMLRVALETARFEAARPVTVDSIVPGDYIVLRVSDTGTGIPEDVLERMFDPFFTTKEVGVGTGLGLSLVHGIVTSVGGAIEVATERGKGTTFTVYLRRSGDATEGSTDETPPLPRGEGQRVLVVDDEEPLVRLATETLEELGYVALGFTSSAAALEAIRADPQHFDAVITDERMPGMTGSALIRQVRDIRDGIPILLVTGFVGGGALDRARDAGADEVLKKPLSARELATSLARVLRF